MDILSINNKDFIKLIKREKGNFQSTQNISHNRETIAINLFNPYNPIDFPNITFFYDSCNSKNFFLIDDSGF